MNKVILMGRLTRDPNVRYTQQNGSQESMCVARYTLAVDRRGARDGQQSADFISCVAFGKNGEFAETGNKNCYYWQDSDGFIHQQRRAKGIYDGCCD